MLRFAQHRSQLIILVTFKYHNDNIINRCNLYNDKGHPFIKYKITIKILNNATFFERNRLVNSLIELILTAQRNIWKRDIHSTQINEAEFQL